jgi:hypothetical protein
MGYYVFNDCPIYISFSEIIPCRRVAIWEEDVIVLVISPKKAGVEAIA